MVAATAAVILSRQTHPAALLVLSAAVMAAGLVGLMVHRALSAFAGATPEMGASLGDRTREAMVRDKALVLRSIKELEFDRATGKVGDADFKDMNARLRAKAVSLMEALERAPTAPAAAAPRVQPARACPTCRTVNDTDARFCKQCGGRLA